MDLGLGEVHVPKSLLTNRCRRIVILVNLKPTRMRLAGRKLAFGWKLLDACLGEFRVRDRFTILGF